MLKKMMKATVTTLLPSLLFALLSVSITNAQSGTRNGSHNTDRWDYNDVDIMRGTRRQETVPNRGGSNNTDARDYNDVDIQRGVRQQETTPNRGGSHNTDRWDYNDVDIQRGVRRQETPVPNRGGSHNTDRWDYNDVDIQRDTRQDSPRYMRSGPTETELTNYNVDTSADVPVIKLPNGDNIALPHRHLWPGEAYVSVYQLEFRGRKQYRVTISDSTSSVLDVIRDKGLGVAINQGLAKVVDGMIAEVATGRVLGHLVQVGGRGVIPVLDASPIGREDFYLYPSTNGVPITTVITARTTRF